MERSKQVLLPFATSSRSRTPPQAELDRKWTTGGATWRCLSLAVLLLALTCGAGCLDASEAPPLRVAPVNRTQQQQQRPSRPPPLPPLGGGDRMLKSSKDALIVTKKSYLKKDWCKTEPLIQRVREAGCVTRTVVNRFCYGQCNSFYIPKNAKADMDATAFKSCSFCKPKRFRWIAITLRCPGRHPPYKRKRIQRIKKCKCISEILQ